MPADARWTFVTDHAHVLLAVAEDPAIGVSVIAQRVEIDQAAVRRILSDLEREGYLIRTEEGPGYSVVPHRPMRHPADRGHEVDGLIALLGSAGDPGIG